MLTFLSSYFVSMALGLSQAFLYQQWSVGGGLTDKRSGISSHLAQWRPTPPRPGQKSSTAVRPLSCRCPSPSRGGVPSLKDDPYLAFLRGSWADSRASQPHPALPRVFTISLPALSRPLTHVKLTPLHLRRGPDASHPLQALSALRSKLPVRVY